VRDGRHADVVGEGVVMLVDGRRGRGALLVRVARAGQRIDLEKRTVR
jgi:hypothetical protein